MLTEPKQPCVSDAAERAATTVAPPQRHFGGTITIAASLDGESREYTNIASMALVSRSDMPRHVACMRQVCPHGIVAGANSHMLMIARPPDPDQ